MEIHNGLDVIDSRDVIARIEELQAILTEFLPDTLKDCLDSTNGVDNIVGQIDDIPGLDAIDELQELYTLLNLAEQCQGNDSEWEDGQTLIRDNYFEEFAEEEAYEIGFLDRQNEGRWPYNCIDWKAAAEQLQMDYTCVDFDGVDYWVR